MLISVGTSAVPRRAISAIRSSVSPVPCSMQSIPAPISPGSASVPKTCAVTRAPSTCAASIAAASTSSGHSGARSPTSRSIQSPTSLTQPSPARACSRTASGSSAGSSSSTAEARDVALGPPEVPAGPDDLRQVRAVLQRPGVDRGAAVADQQRARVAVGLRLDVGLVERHRPARARSRRGSARRPARARGTRRRPSVRAPADRPVDEAAVRRRTARPRARRPGRAACRGGGTLAHLPLGNFSFEGSKPGGSWSSPPRPGGSSRRLGGSAERSGIPAGVRAPGRATGLPFVALLALAALRQPLGGAAAAEPELARHLLHHLAGLEEPGDQVVDVADRHARPVRDAQPPRAVDDLRVGPLGRASCRG